MVQHTIKTVYPKYYPVEVVNFFCEHHSKEAIEKDIEKGLRHIYYENNRGSDWQKI